MNRRRNATQTDPQVQRLRMVRQLSESLQIPIADLRLVETWFHDGTQWTMNSRWEQVVDQQWQEVPWTTLTQALSRT